MERAADPVRIAVIGLGYWGPNLVRNLHELPDAEVAAVCDLSEPALAKIRRRYPAIRQERSLDAILADPSIEAVAIATPVASHHPIARQAIQAGKHVFVEKPLAGSVEGASELVRLGRESQRAASSKSGESAMFRTRFGPQ